MKKERVEIWVGFFVFLGLCALFFLAFKAANLGSSVLGSDMYKVSAQFDNIGGLKPRAAVKSAGVVVGRVESISFDDKTYKAVVLLNLDKRYVFPDDSGFQILTSGLLGDQYVGIEPGGSEKALVEGSKAEFTQSAVVLENLISQFLYSKADEGAAKK